MEELKVNFETAQHLVKLGFVWGSYYVYSTTPPTAGQFSICYRSPFYNDLKENLIEAPTLSAVLYWLWENHNIHIATVIQEMNGELLYTSQIQNWINGKVKDSNHLIPCRDYNESVQEAIIFVLENYTIDKKLKEFLTKRKVFCYNQTTGVFYVPTGSDKNSCIADWMTKFNFDVEKLTRGYTLDNYVHLYIGKDFHAPDLTTKELLKVASKFQVEEIRLGCKVGKPGDVWEPLYTLKITSDLVKKQD